MRRKLKCNETRHWWCAHRGPIAIHAAKKPWKAEEYPEFLSYFQPEQMAYGSVVCIARMVGCEKTERISDKISQREYFWGNYENGRYAWMTSPADLIVLPEPIPLRGQQGLFEWELPPEVERMVNAKYPDLFTESRSLEDAEHK